MGIIDKGRSDMAIQIEGGTDIRTDVKRENRQKEGHAICRTDRRKDRQNN